MKPLWLPNLLTVLRCFAAVGVAVCLWLVLEGAGPDNPLVETGTVAPVAITALALFVFAAVSDFLDGFLARRWNAQSDFGRLLDPIADKLLVGLPFLVISALLIRTGDWRGMVFVALPMLAIIARDVGVTALRFSPRGGAKVEVAVLSKWKTALEMIVLGFLLAALGLSLPVSTATAVIWLAALWAAAVVSLYTGYRYFRAAYG